MVFRKRLSYSLSGAILVTALSHLLPSPVKELLFYPGKFLDVCFNFLVFFFAEERHPDHIHTGLFFNILFYGSFIYILLRLTAPPKKSLQ